MKNQLIATIVGAIILFVWQFVSWAALNLHGNETQYAPNQDAILTCLAENLEPGHYMMPQPAPGSSQAEMEAYMKNVQGKPWALISYHSSLEFNMGGNLLRGFLVDLIAVFLLVWLMGKMPGLDMATALMAAIIVGVIGYLTIPYLNHIWFETPSLAYLIDSVVPWGLVGLWLGWYLRK